MALSFPPNPQIGDTYVAPNGYTYTWDGTKWYVTSGGSGGGGTGGGALIIKKDGVIVNSSATTLDFRGAYITATSTISNVLIEVVPKIATTSSIGSVKIGSGVTVTPDGTISVQAGLSYWQESYTIIDSTQTAIVSLFVSADQPDVDMVLSAKGDGATVGSIGGNKRAPYSVDWQKVRGQNDQVASGDYSIIGGGSFNKASGLHSIVIGGNQNINTGSYGVILGGEGGTTRGIIGSVVTPGFASGGIQGESGAMQTAVFVIGGYTYSSSPVRLSTNGNPTPTPFNQIRVGDMSSMWYKGTVMARDQVSKNSAVWSFEGLMTQTTGSSTTDFYPPGIAPVVTKITATSTATNSWDLVLDIDNITGCLVINATGDANNTVRWTGKVETIEITDVS
jgi:hypothetical protein